MKLQKDNWEVKTVLGCRKPFLKQHQALSAFDIPGYSYTTGLELKNKSKDDTDIVFWNPKTILNLKDGDPVDQTRVAKDSLPLHLALSLLHNLLLAPRREEQVIFLNKAAEQNRCDK